MPAKLAPTVTFLSAPPPLTCPEQDEAVYPRGYKLSKPGLGSSLPVHHPEPQHQLHLPQTTASLFQPRQASAPVLMSRWG